MDLKKFTKGLNKNIILINLKLLINQQVKKLLILKIKKIILFVGRLNASKGYDLFGKAIIVVIK